jgi:hypothetical protein
LGVRFFHAMGAYRVLQLLRSKIRLNFVGVTSQSLIFRDHTLTLCKIPRHATGGNDDAYRVLQLLRSKIRLNFVGPSQVLIRVHYSYPILDFRITNIIYYNKYWGGFGGAKPPREREWRAPPRMAYRVSIFDYIPIITSINSNKIK